MDVNNITYQIPSLPFIITVLPMTYCFVRRITFYPAKFSKREIFRSGYGLMLEGVWLSLKGLVSNKRDLRQIKEKRIENGC